MIQLPNNQLLESQFYMIYPGYVYPYYWCQPNQPKMKPIDVNEPSQSECVISGCPPLKQLESYVRNLIEQDESADSLIKQCKKQQQEQLALILEKIKQKCQKTSKSREELIKYCLRKALKYMFKKVQLENEQTNLKSAKRIFSETIFHESQVTGVFPFKKDSINKTMNQEFLKELFSSQKFLKNYEEFLQHFDDVIQKDKQKKIQSLCHNILNHIVNDKKKPFDVKRLPWSDNLIEKTKQIAYQLLIQK